MAFALARTTIPTCELPIPTETALRWRRQDTAPYHIEAGGWVSTFSCFESPVLIRCQLSLCTPGPHRQNHSLRSLKLHLCPGWGLQFRHCSSLSGLELNLKSLEIQSDGDRGDYTVQAEELISELLGTFSDLEELVVSTIIGPWMWARTQNPTLYLGKAWCITSRHSRYLCIIRENLIGPMILKACLIVLLCHFLYKMSRVVE